jgi:hypothetical protein
MTTLRAHPKTDATHDDAADQPRVTRSYLAWLAIALVSLAGLVALTVAIASKVVFPVDQSLLAWAQNWAAWKLLWQVISETANIPLIVIGLGFVLWLFFV